jgi:glycosyltransferase involved in cell wall biosynthesis
MEKKKLLFISNMASPYQVKFCYALQEYFDAEFWFYVRREPNRPEWWDIPLGDKCKVMSRSGDMPKVGYYSLDVFSDLDKFRPDVILLGGFMNWHWLVMKWAKKNNSKVVFMSEILRNTKHDHDASNSFMSRENSPRKVKALRKIFGGADLYLGMGESAAKQFREELGFPSDKVDKIEYPTDIDEYFSHPLREKKAGDPYVLLFANRLIDRYQPLFALEVFRRIHEKYPNTHMKMNKDGPLKQDCIDFIEKHNLKTVSFLDDIDSWNNMNLVYKDADIFILPVTYSNGNLSMFEAASSGMGVIISIYMNSVEGRFIDGRNCFIRDLNIEDFVDCVEQYIENPELLVKHGKESRKLMETKRNKNTAKVYHDMLLKHGLI